MSPLSSGEQSHRSVPGVFSVLHNNFSRAEMKEVHVPTVMGVRFEE